MLRSRMAEQQTSPGLRLMPSLALRLALVLAAILPLLTCSNQPPGPESRTELLLGTTVTITVYDEAPDNLFEDVFARIRDIEARMSTSEQDYESTELMEVNRAAGKRAVKVSEDTFRVVSAGLEFARMTDGAFDITVQPLVDLWGIGTEHERVPSENEIAAALQKVDYRRVRLDADDRTIYLPEEGMGLDVGGIAKGYAADEVARLLSDKGVEHALLDFGGNILTLGMKPDGSRWRIGIQNPGQSRGQYLGIVTTGPRTIVTSGNYERYFERDGVRYHHILDTDTGYPARTGLSSVTIVSDGSMAADALSTAAYVMGPAEGLPFIEKLPDVHAAFVTKDSRVFLSEGMESEFEVTNDAYRGITDPKPAELEIEVPAKTEGQPQFQLRRDGAGDAEPQAGSTRS